MTPLGRIVEVNLDSRVTTSSAYPEEPARALMVGRGFNVWYLRHRLNASVEPLDPGNILIFSCGLLTGTAAPSSSRLHINALSPLTGLMGSSSVGGGVGGALRSCGIQSLIMTGRASRPVYLEIDEDSVTVRDARALWGMDTWETAAHFEAGGGPKGALLTIGPGGENGVRFGCIMSGKDHAAGRTGMGTVMGSKHLKAVVVNGRRQGAKLETAEARRAVGGLRSSHQEFAGISHVRSSRRRGLRQVGRRHGHRGHSQLPPDSFRGNRRTGCAPPGNRRLTRAKLPSLSGAVQGRDSTRPR